MVQLLLWYLFFPKFSIRSLSSTLAYLHTTGSIGGFYVGSGLLDYSSDSVSYSVLLDYYLFDFCCVVGSPVALSLFVVLLSFAAGSTSISYSLFSLGGLIGPCFFSSSSIDFYRYLSSSATIFCFSRSASSSCSRLAT